MDDEVWEALQSQGSSLKQPAARLLKQGDEAWKLDEEDLDLAAYEQLLLTLPASPHLLPNAEIETLDYVRSKFYYTTRRHKAIAMSVALGSQQAEIEVASAGSDFVPKGWLEKAGDDKRGKYKKRWFELDGMQLEYFNAPGGKSKGTIELASASEITQVGCDAASGEFVIVTPGRRYELRCGDVDTLPFWVLAITQIIAESVVAIEGPLEKQGAKHKSFKVRYFRMAGSKIYYYKGEAAEGKPAGVIDLKTATRCRAMEDEDEPATPAYPFSIVVDGRAWILRAKTHEFREQWVGHICSAVPDLGGMDGFLLKEAHGKGKDRERWFALKGKDLMYFKGPEAKQSQGSISLTNAAGCRPADGAGSSFVIEMNGARRRGKKGNEKPGRIYKLQAKNPEECRDWIRSINQAVHEVAHASSDAGNFDDSDMPDSHLLEHRFALLQEKRCEGAFNGDVGAFMRWRKRQLVIWASGVDHQLGHLMATNSAAEVGLGQARKQLVSAVQGILGSRPAAWGATEEEDYCKRLSIIADLKSKLELDAANFTADEAEYLHCYPLHVGTLFLERLLSKTCFEDMEDDDFGSEDMDDVDDDDGFDGLGFGGGVDFTQKDNLDELLQHLGKRLHMPEGLYEITFAYVLAEQYKKRKQHELIELLREELAELMPRTPAAKVQAAEPLMLHMQKYCNDVLSCYHELDDPSMVPDFVQIFACLMKLRGKLQDAVDGKLREQIDKSVRKRYALLWEQATAAEAEEMEMRGEEAEQLDILQRFCETLSEQVELEVDEYAAYIGTEMSLPEEASVKVAEVLADGLNRDIARVYEAVTEMTDQVMICWQALRGIEAAIIEVMARCGHVGEGSKLLNVEESLAKVARQWVVSKAAECKKRKDTSIEMETWEPVNEEQAIAVCAIDITTMLISVAKQYFDAALPLSATDEDSGKPVVQILAHEFGLVMLSFGSTVLRQCGGEPPPPRDVARGGKHHHGLLGGHHGGGASPNSNSPGGAWRGRGHTLGQGLRGLMSDVDGSSDEARAEEGEPPEMVAAGTVSVEELCIRLSTIDYIADHCVAPEDESGGLLNVIKDGCARMMAADELDGMNAALEKELRHVQVSTGPPIKTTTLMDRCMSVLAMPCCSHVLPGGAHPCLLRADQAA